MWHPEIFSLVVDGKMSLWSFRYVLSIMRCLIFVGFVNMMCIGDVMYSWFSIITVFTVGGTMRLFIDGDWMICRVRR